MSFDINDLNIIYEDNHIIVVVKPVGIPVQQDKSGDIDMLTIIKKQNSALLANLLLEPI